MTEKSTAIAKILHESKTIAVVGISDREERPAHSVPAYLQAAGYRIIPVNPKLDTVLGEKAYPDLYALPDELRETVDVVQLFRRAENVPPHVEEAIAIGARAIWMQSGIVNSEAAAHARAAGLTVVMDACMRTEHRRAQAQEPR